MDGDHNTKIKLHRVVNGDLNEIDKLTQLLSARGWCFVEFEEEFIKEYESAFTAASSFLSSSEQQRQRLLHHKHFGYIQTQAKHGLHVLTGKRLEEFSIPITMYRQLRSLSVSIDTLSKKLYEVAGTKLFAKNKSFQEEALQKILLLEPHVYGGKRSEYGMLDIMQYHVPSTVDDEEVSKTTSVSEHGDPGLFSFSFKSDQPGLSMLDPITTTWVPVPPNTSVMWCGSAAEEISKGLLKVGWHRVEKTFTEPRLTMWYEVCTYEQVPEQFRNNDIAPSKEEVAQRPVENYPSVKVKTLTGKEIEFVSKLHSSNTVMDLQELIQDREGIPPSKQRLMMAPGRMLVSDRTLGFYGYESGQIVYLVLALRGIELNRVVNGDSNEIDKLTQLLSARGWCFVEFDEQFRKDYDRVFTAASSFFSGSEERRKRFIHHKNFGYITKPAKHGLHVLTGERLKEFPIPLHMYSYLRTLSSSIDTLSKKLYEVAGPKLFAKNTSYQQEALEKIALVAKRSARTGYGMFDIMQYHVPSTVDGDDVSKTTSVSEHGDPGLFSFSFKSDQPGLSMLDPSSNTWIPVPQNASVMWCGSAAEEISKGLLKVGWHRVEKTFTEPRLTMWYEVCTYEQVPEQFRNNDIVPSKEELEQLPIEVYPSVKVYTLTGKAIEFVSQLSSASTIEDLQLAVEQREGLPPAKQRMAMAGRALLVDRTLGFYRYESGKRIDLVLRLEE